MVSRAARSHPECRSARQRRRSLGAPSTGGIRMTDNGAAAAAAAEPTTELRLALVCYGGVSLAVYMHGVTKELHKLVCAARAFDNDSATNRFHEGQTEAVYFEALRSISTAGRKLSVSIDI